MNHQPDKKGDWNHDIHIRDIKEEDFYDGITVQSYGNTNCIYELRFIDNKWCYKPIAHIENRFNNAGEYSLIPGKLDSILKKCDGSFSLQKKEQWSETHYSILLNKIIRRDKLLNDLLNEV